MMWRGTVLLWATLLTHSLTPHSTVLLEKLTGLQLVKKFPTCYGTRRFITAFTSACRRSLSWASLIHSTPPHPTSRSTLILSSHLRLGLPKWSLSLRFPHQKLHTLLHSPIRATWLAHLIPLDLIIRTILCELYRLSSSLCSFLHSLSPRPSKPQIFPSTPHSRTPSACIPLSMWRTKFHTHTKPSIHIIIKLILHTANSHNKFINPVRHATCFGTTDQTQETKYDSETRRNCTRMYPKYSGLAPASKQLW
jgi:hypothetical protein